MSRRDLEHRGVVSSVARLAAAGVRAVTAAGVLWTALIPASSVRAQAELVWTKPLPTALDDLALVEPFLAVDPTDPRHLVGAGMVVNAAGLSTVVVISRDGGRSWIVGRDAATGDRLFPDGDPVVAMSPDGTPYLSTLDDGFSVWRRGPADSVWLRQARVPGGTYDRQWIAFDRSDGPHHGRLYTAGKLWIQVMGHPAQDVAAFSWSDDGGATFRSPVLVLPDPAQGSLNIVGELQVLRDGSLLAPYHFIHWPYRSRPPENEPADALDGQIAVLRSTDGRYWEDPVRVGRLLKWGHGDQRRMFKSMMAGGLATGPAPGDQGVEMLHMVWLDIVQGALQVMAAHSSDGGRQWSAPVRVNQGGFRSNHSNPGVAVDGLGRVGVVWNDRRNYRGEECFTPYFAVSTDGGSTFAAEQPLTDGAVCPQGRWMNGGETQGIVGLPDGGFHLLWVGPGPRGDAPRLFSSRISVP